MIMLYFFTLRLHRLKRTSHLKTRSVQHVQETKIQTSFGLKVPADFISTLETEPSEWRQQDRVDKTPPCVTAPLPHTTATLLFVLQRCQHSSCMLGQSARWEKNVFHKNQRGILKSIPVWGSFLPIGARSSQYQAPAAWKSLPLNSRDSSSMSSS